MAHRGEEIVVGLLYALILVPVVIYLVFSILEIWIVYKLSEAPRPRSTLFIQVSTELTHTFLVFAYAQFMVTHAELLTHIGAALYAPVALLMMSLLVRASYYLVIFYSPRISRVSYQGLLATYLLGILSIIWGLVVATSEIVTTGYTPDTSSVPLVLSVGLPALILLLIPSIIVYKKALQTVRK